MGSSQEKIIELVEESLGTKVNRKKKFPWLKNKPVPEYFDKYYSTAMNIFFSLGGHEEGLASKRAIRLTYDAYLPLPYNCLLEFDEIQHFTEYRLKTLKLYPREIRYGFSIEAYKKLSQRYHQEAMAKGADTYRLPKKEFPFQNGRAAQRAFFDMFKDLLPVLHGLNPTIRITEFEVEDILKNQISRDNAVRKLKRIIESRWVYSNRYTKT